MKFFVLIFLFPFTVLSQTVWDGGGDGVNWEDQDNWDGNVLPCSSCDVIIDKPGVVLNTAITVNSLLIDHNIGKNTIGDLLISSGSSLSVSNPGGVGVEISHNTSLTIAGSLFIDGSDTGLLNKIDGTLSLSVGAVINISNTDLYGYRSEGVNTILGNVSINKCGAGMSNARLMNISGDVIIEDADGEGFVNIIDSFGALSELNINASGKLTILKAGSHGIYTRTKINNAGEIIIDDSGARGISFDSPYATSTIVNSGSIAISDATTTGLFKTSFGNLHNTNTGSMEISGGYAGVSGDDLFVNDGDIQVSDATLGIATAMINNADITIRNCVTGLTTTDFVNNSIATLAIAQSSNIGLNMPNGSFDNDGLINIDTCGIGIQLYDVQNTFTNSGAITVRKTVNYGIYSWGAPSKISRFHNTSSGEVSVLFAGSVGVSLDGPLTNEGEMIVYDSFNAGMLLSDKVTNSGIINTARSGQFGITFSSASIPDTLHNTASGEITMEDDHEGISCLRGVFINEGLVEIKGTNSDGLELNRNEFQNSGQVLMDDIGNEGLLIYFSENAHFHNKTGGVLSIDDTGADGIDCSKKLTNEGSITVTDSGIDGIYHHSSSDTVLNEGQITILNSGRYGLHNRGSLDTCFLWNTSAGVIEINQTVDIGLLNFRTNFFNEGLLDIQNAAEGFHFVGGQLTGAPPWEVRNFGRMYISNSVGDGFVSSGEFSNKAGGKIDISNSGNYDLNGLDLHNEPCGIIKLDGSMYISPNRELLNDGFLVQQTLDTNNINGALTNNGVFVEYNGLAPIIGYGNSGNKFFNNGHLIQPPQGMLTSGFKEYYFVTEGNSPHYSLGTPIWANAAHTLSGATFNSADQLLNPLPSGPTADSLYFTFTDGTCTYDQPVNVNNGPDCSGVTVRNALFYGSISDDWHDRFNWLPNLMPGACTNVKMNAFVDLNIPPNTRARARTIEVSAISNNVFESKAGSVMNIDAGN